MNDSIKTVNLKKNKTAQVVENLPLSDEIYKITLDNKYAAREAIPGQFISILCKNLILRRPFSIAKTENDLIHIIYKLKGEGTQFISQLRSGESIDFIGPFGNGFNITEENSLLIGAGVGIAPLIFLSKELKQRQVPYTLAAGFQSFVNIPDLCSHSYYIITEDGSSGHSGMITEYLEKLINRDNPQKIYACGPEPVLKYIASLSSQYNINSELALERKFACGTGVCMGCTIQITENNEVKNRRICKDGPVFDGRSIIWQ